MMTDDKIRALLDGATPGPWAVLSPGHHVGMREVSGPTLRCLGFTIATDVDAERARAIEADARLIAAAPDIAAECLRRGEELARVTKERDDFVARLNTRIAALEADAKSARNAAAGSFARAERAEALLAEAVEALRPFAIEHAWDGVTRFEIVLASQTGSIKGADLDLALATLAKLEARHD